MENNITIIEESCSGCPMIWDVELDGQPAYIRYRWGIISLKLVTEKCGLFQDAEISEQIGDEYDGVLDLTAAIEWLHSKGYNVIPSSPQQYK